MLVRITSAALLVAALGFALSVQALFPRFVVDDAYITFRYAENLALRGELNWNPGEDPVEGYTGVLFPVLLAGFIKAGVSPIMGSRVISLLSYWLGFASLFLLARRISLPALPRNGLLLLYATTPILFTHAFSGMETTLFVALMLASLASAVGRRDALFALLLLLTSLTRPEGVAFSFFAFAAVAFARRREGAAALRAFLLRSLGIYLLPAALYFSWRFSYYGQLLPNTFYAKLEGGFQTDTLIDIARFLRRYLAVPFLGLLLLWGAETDALWKTLQRWIRERAAAVYLGAGLLFCLSVALVLANSHLIANFSHRFYVPFLPPLLVLLAFGWKLGFASLEETRGERPARYFFAQSVFLGLVLYQALFQAIKIRDEFTFARRQVILHEDVHNAVGAELARILSPSETVIVYLDAGAIPYFSRLRAVDFGNLNDELLASRALSPAGRIDYFFNQRAAALSFSSIDPEKVVYAPEAEAILADPRFGNYALYKKYRPRDPEVEYYQLVYLRTDIYENIARGAAN